MRLTLTLAMICVFTVNLFAQTKQKQVMEERNCATMGILEGGGSLIGADFEFLLTDRFGFQLGAGFVGFGGGLNYHFRPTVRSSFISLQYMHQGINETYTQSLIGPLYVYRGKKWFTFQAGFGAPIEKGPKWPHDKDQPDVMLLYALGIYLPF